MNVKQFRQAHENSWRELERACRTRRQSFKSAEQLDAYARLYRQVSSHLSYAKTHFPTNEVTEYLNSLVGIAHNRFYQADKTGFSAVWRFVATDLPALFRRMGGYIAVSAGVSLAAMLYGYIVTLHSPLAAYQMVPAQIAGVNTAHIGPHTWDDPVIASEIMVNNILVSLYAFVGGVTLGLFTLYILWKNGLMLGVLAALVQPSHKTAVFWSLILPHGVTELTAIFISGGAGLAFAHRIISPGQYGRSRSLVHALREAVSLMFGVAGMLLIAGTIEGFLTPSFLPLWVKYGTAILTAVLWFLYYGWAGRKNHRPDSGDSRNQEGLRNGPAMRDS